jgi:ubiquitin-conjugating enzyme E2 Q
MESKCPVCGLEVVLQELENHVNRCIDSTTSTTPESKLTPCPLCGVEFPASQIERHAGRCDGGGTSTFHCHLCGQTTVPLDHCYRLDECSHPFCKHCVERYATEHLLHTVSLRCPSCNAAFSIRDINLLIPQLQKKGKSGVGSWTPKQLNPTRRLMEELRHLEESQCWKHGFRVEVVNDNLFEWNAYFFGFDAKDEPIAKDLKKVSGERITLQVKFPKDYPIRPPSVRVLRPRLQHLTGHVTIGGSVCFEMLTSQGWQPQFTVESLMISIRANLVAGGARVDFSNTSDYTEAEAKSAFDRMLSVHGWRND